METPLVQALHEYIIDDITPFHMPGHKGGKGFSASFIRDLPRMDVTEVPGLDNLQAPAGVIRRAQNLAAGVFGSDACFFLVNGSTSGLHTMILTAVKPGETLLVPRNSHKAVWDALVLSGAKPVYIQPEYDVERSLITQVSVEAVRKAVQENPQAAGLLLTNPNYYGMTPRMMEIHDVLREKEMLLLVDEAHGAHFVFHPALPPSSAHCGADVWVQSAHKTLPALTQSAYLQARAGRVDMGRLTQIHRMLQSTSPSYLLMASLDYARGYMEEQGKVLLDRLLECLAWTRRELEAMGFDTMGAYPRTETGISDPTRLVLDISRFGWTGYEGEAILRRAGIQVEMADCRRLVFICTVADGRPVFEKLVEACRSLARPGAKSKERGHFLSISREIPKQLLSPKEAFEHAREYVPLREAAGRICSGLVGAYPPGIPRFCPGEALNPAGIQELLGIEAQGGQLFGLTEGFIPVVVE